MAVLSHLKSRTHERAKWFVNHSQTVCKPNAHMCRWDCEPALHHLRTVRILFAANQNLLVFYANTKRTAYTGCPFYAPGILCSPQVCGKLINRAPNKCRTRMAQRVSGMLVYTRFNDSLSAKIHKFKKNNKKILKTMLLWTSRSVGGTKRIRIRNRNLQTEITVSLCAPYTSTSP